MKNDFPIEIVFKILDKESKKWKVPIVTLIALQDKDPFKVFLSVIISLRTKDEVTIQASKRLFKLLKQPKDIYNISINQIGEAIYPAGFYRRKAIQIDKICRKLVEKFDSKIPQNIDTLLTFEGVGRKSANLILAEGYQIPAMCVDTHVHRISNRFGFINTKNPEQSEYKLREILAKKYWIRYNSLLVSFGQSICKPISPFCSKCPVLKYCQRIGIEKSR